MRHPGRRDRCFVAAGNPGRSIVAAAIRFRSPREYGRACLRAWNLGLAISSSAQLRAALERVFAHFATRKPSPK